MDKPMGRFVVDITTERTGGNCAVGDAPAIEAGAMAKEPEHP